MAHLLAPLPKRWGSIFIRLMILRSICCRSHGNSAPRVVLVPELTAIADIKLDERHSLLRHKDRLR